jgi:alpha-ketoglutarate-dependent taurine dioxygenase
VTVLVGVWVKTRESPIMQPMFSNVVDSVLEKRIKQLYRAFRRELHSPKSTTIQQALIERAARLTAIAEALAHSPDCKPSHLVLMDNRAQAARAEMFASFGKREAKRLTFAEIRAAAAHA